MGFHLLNQAAIESFVSSPCHIVAYFWKGDKNGPASAEHYSRSMTSLEFVDHNWPVSIGCK
jgi:hypothetical protein